MDLGEVQGCIAKESATMEVLCSSTKAKKQLSNHTKNGKNCLHFQSSHDHGNFLLCTAM